MTVEMTPEKFAEATGMKLSVVYDYLNSRAPVMWDPRDVRRLSRAQVLLAVAAPNSSGRGARPAVIPNPNYKHPRRSVHVSGGASTVDVVAVQRAGGAGVPQPGTQDVQGDAALSVVGGEGMPQGLQVAGRKASR
jgi:hypothetical protein